MDFRVLSLIIWAGFFFGPPLMLAWAVPLVYADANEKVGGKGRLSTGWFALIFACALVVWALVLRLLYLPAIGFSLGNNPTAYNYGDIHSVQVFWLAASYWMREQTTSAVSLLGFPVIAASAIVLYARYLGLNSRRKEPWADSFNSYQPKTGRGGKQTQGKQA